jgi:RNA polymerase sigma-70 factor (ECF subfamily)
MNKAFLASPWALAAATATEAQDSVGAARDLASEESATRARADEIARIYGEHNRALIKFVLRRVRNEQEARDVAQEAYLRLLELGQAVAVEHLRWYLFKIARNIATDRHRQSKVHARVSELDARADLDPSSPTENGAIAVNQLAALLSALEELPENCRQAFLLHKVRGLSTLEVADCMQITDRMVRNHIRRALLYCRLRCDGLPREAALQLAR